MATFPPQTERWRPLVEKYFPPELVEKALWTIQNESGGNPSAVGDGGAARGLFQIQDSRNFSNRPDAAYLDDPENNIRYAAQQLGAANGNFGAWGEGTTHNGQPFGAFGHNVYTGEGGGTVSRAMPVVDYSDPEIDAEYQRLKKEYFAAKKAWEDAGHPQEFMYDEETGELVPNPNSPEGFRFAIAQRLLTQHTQNFGQPRPANDTDPAQRAFDNALALEDLDLRKADDAWRRFTDKLASARDATSAEINAARQRNEDENPFGTQTSSGLVINRAGGTRHYAPDYAKAFERWKGEMGVGEEPATSGYVDRSTLPPPPGTAATEKGPQARLFDEYSSGFTGPAPAGGSSAHSPEDQKAIQDWYNSIPRAGYNTGDSEALLRNARLGIPVNPPFTSTPGAPTSKDKRTFTPGTPPWATATGASTPPTSKDKPWWKKLPGFANGVMGFKGGEAMVGERGPEMVQVPGFGDFMVGIDGPEVKNLPSGSNVIPMDQQYLFHQIQQAARTSGPGDMARQAEEAQARANDPQLQQKVMDSLRLAMAGQWATSPPATPVLVGEGWAEDPWADRRPLTGIPADPTQYQAMQQQAAAKGGR